MSISNQHFSHELLASPDTTALDLMQMSRDLGEKLARVKHDIAAVDAEISRRFSEQVKAAYAQAGKQHGKVSVPTDRGVVITAETSRTVKYDQTALRDLAAGMTWEDVNHFFKITFDVPEAVFKGLPPGDPRKPALTAARITKYGDPKISLEAAS